MKEKGQDSNNPLNLLNESADSCSSVSGSYLGCSVPPDPQLIADGWARRFIGDARMARDAVDTYTDVGYEVRLEEVDPGQLNDDCGGCKVMFAHFRAVYTRKKK